MSHSVKHDSSVRSKRCINAPVGVCIRGDPEGQSKQRRGQSGRNDGGVSEETDGRKHIWYERASQRFTSFCQHTCRFKTDQRSLNAATHVH